jgi:hypothetical protein
VPAKQRPETLAFLSTTVGDLAKNGQTLLLAVDHADHLTDDVIAELAQLPEYLDVSPNRLLRVFIGSMALASRIDSILRRLGVDQHLSEIRLSQPTADEVAALLAYEDSAQAGGPMLTSGAIDRISAYAKSNLHWAVPMADAARVLAESEGLREVTAELVRSALLEIWSPEQELPDALPLTAGQDGLNASDPSTAGIEAHRGLSDSVSHAPEFIRAQDPDALVEPGREDPQMAGEAIAATKSARRYSVERVTPIASVLLFLLGTIALGLSDKSVDVVAPQAPGPVSEEARHAEQSPSVSPEIPGESGKAIEWQDPSIQGSSMESTGLGSNAEQNGPWPQSESEPQDVDPNSAPDETNGVPAAKAPASEKPLESKTGPKRNKAAIKSPEKRPDDLSSNHWIQKR